MQKKICTKCKIEKQLNEFSKKKSTKDGLKCECKACEKLYREANKEHILAYQKLHYEANRDERLNYYKLHRKKEYVVARDKQRYQDNKESFVAYAKQWNLANKEHIAAYLQANKDERAAKAKQYRQTPEGKAADKSNRNNRRSRKKNNGGKHTGAQILALFDLQSGKCPYCKSKLSKTGSNKYHVDHVMPLSKGGSNDISNIQLLCPKCNLSKSDKLPEQFAVQFGKLL